MPVIDKTQLGLKKETTYGTRVVPDAFFEFESEGLTFDQRFGTSRQLGSGVMVARGSRRKKMTGDGSGPVTMEVPNKSYGKLLDLCHDNVITPVQQGGTTAYLQTHNIGLTAPTKSATIQVDRPDSSNTDRPFDYLGCMMAEAAWSISQDGYLMCTHTFNVYDEKTDQTLATRSIPTGLESFSFLEGTLAVGGSTVADVTDWSQSWTFPRNTGFFPLSSTGRQAKPVQNDLSAGTGTLSARFSDLTNYNRYLNGTQVTMTMTFATTTLAGTGHPFTIAFSNNLIALTGETPTVGGPDLIVQNLPYEVFYDGTTAPLVATYKSTDVTV